MHQIALILRSELGWVLSGAAKCVIDVARRRAKLWLSPAGDFYRVHFCRAAERGGTTWACLSLKLLRDSVRVLLIMGYVPEEVAAGV